VSFASFASFYRVSSNILPHPISPPCLFDRPHRVYPQHTASSVRSVTQAQPSLCPMTQPAQRPGIKRSIHTLPPFPVDIDSSSSAEPATSFSTPPMPRSRPKACSARKNSTPSFVFRSFDGSRSRQRRLLSRTWNQTLTLRVHGTLVLDQGRKITRVCGIQCV